MNAALAVMSPILVWGVLSLYSMYLRKKSKLDN